MANRPPISKIAKRFKRLHSSMKATIFIAVAGSLLAFSNCYSSTINVGVKPVEPFAFDKDGTLSGFSVELWKKISEECNLVSEFTPVSTVPDLLILIRFQDEMYYAFFSGCHENPPSIRLSSIKPKKSPTIPSAPAPSAYASLFCFPRGSEPRWNKSHPSLA